MYDLVLDVVDLEVDLEFSAGLHIEVLLLLVPVVLLFEVLDLAPFFLFKYCSHKYFPHLLLRLREERLLEVLRVTVVSSSSSSTSLSRLEQGGRDSGSATGTVGRGLRRGRGLG